MAISIVIVAYRSADEIGDCLASIPEMVGEQRVEAIVVDNSRDAVTEDLVAKKFPRTTYVDPGDNLGFGRANNLGFSKSSGDRILFLNPDTVVNEGALAACCNHLGAADGVGLVSPRLVLADGTLDLACRRSIPTIWDGFCRASGLARLFSSHRLFAGYNLTYLPENGCYDVGAINGAFMMTRRDCLERVGLFDENFFMYGDDLDLCYRFSQAGYRIIYDGAHSIIHLKGQSVGREYASMSQAIFDANKAFYLKHFTRPGRPWTRWKYELAFGGWKAVALARARLSGYRRVKPL